MEVKITARHLTVGIKGNPPFINVIDFIEPPIKRKI
jgi:hypothetical protein